MTKLFAARALFDLLAAGAAVVALALIATADVAWAQGPAGTPAPQPSPQVQAARDATNQAMLKNEQAVMDSCNAHIDSTKTKGDRDLAKDRANKADADLKNAIAREANLAPSVQQAGTAVGQANAVLQPMLTNPKGASKEALEKAQKDFNDAVQKYKDALQKEAERITGELEGGRARGVSQQQSQRPANCPQTRLASGPFWQGMQGTLAAMSSPAAFGMPGMVGTPQGLAALSRDQHCDGWCVDAAWDWYTWCTFASGIPGAPMKVQLADAAGNPTDPDGMKWNVPLTTQWTPTVRLDYTPDTSSTPDKGSTPAERTPVASWGAGTPTEYAGICTQFGAGFYFVPGAQSCVRFGSNSTYEQNKEPIYDAQLRTAGGLSYESTLVNAPAGSTIGYNASAIEHANICNTNTYGAGFYYVPGTDTCIKLGANLKYEWKPLQNGLTITTRYDPQKTLQQLGTNAPVIQQNTPQTEQSKAPETPQQQTTSAEDGQYINIFVKARSWTTGEQPAQFASSMLALPVRDIPDLPGDRPRQDINYDKDRVQTPIGTDGSGKMRIQYSLRAQYGLQDAKPNSNYVLGIDQPRIVGALVNVTGQKPEDVARKYADKLDSIKLGNNPSPFISDRKLGNLFSVIGYDQLVIGAFSYVRLLMMLDGASNADFDDLLDYAWYKERDPADVAEDECRTKLPAIDLDPATSTARHNQLPQATIKLAAVTGKRNGVR